MSCHTHKDKIRVANVDHLAWKTGPTILLIKGSSTLPTTTHFINAVEKCKQKPFMLRQFQTMARKL